VGRALVLWWRIPISMTDLANEYGISFSRELHLKLVDATPLKELEKLLEECRDAASELGVEDPEFPIKLFLAVMFNTLRAFWAREVAG